MYQAPNFKISQLLSRTSNTLNSMILINILNAIHNYQSVFYGIILVLFLIIDDDIMQNGSPYNWLFYTIFKNVNDIFLFNSHRGELATGSKWKTLHCFQK